MPEIVLTASQQRALDLTKSVSVTAGAGSGKTGVLVARYIKTLAENPHAGVRNVLAITFTEKAAAEMKARVREEVEKRIAGGADAARWREILDTLDSAAISTIHSFCLSALREHPVEAEVDPLFETLDETQSRRLREEAVDAALQNADTDPATREHACTLLRVWTRKGIDDVMHSLLERFQTADAWAQAYRELSVEQINRRVLDLVKMVRAEKAAALFSEEMIARLSRFTCTNSKDKIELIRLAVLDVLRRGFDPDNDDFMIHVASDLCGFELRGGSKNNWDDFDGVKDVLREVKAKAIELRDLKPGEIDWAAAPVMKAIAMIYSRARDIYEDRKGRGRALDFEDLQTLALRLLQNHPEIRALLHDRFQAVLVDEFQDTNWLQWDIVRQIVTETSETRGCEDAETRGREDGETRGHGDAETRGHGDAETRGHGDAETRGHGDAETRGREDGKNAGVPMVPSASSTGFTASTPSTPSTASTASTGMPQITRGPAIPPGRLFIVGDPKQSIYRFREAEIRVFGEIVQSFVAGDARVEMDDNFRAAPAPVNFVNALMANLMGASGMAFDPLYRPLVCRRKMDFGGSVAVLLANKNHAGADAAQNNDLAGAGEESAASPAEAELVARRIIWLVQQRAPVWDKSLGALRPARFGDVAILMRSRTRLALYEEALRKHTVPFNVLGGFGLFQRQEVLDLANVLRFLLNRKNDVALAAVLRSPIAGLSDDALYLVSQAPGDGLWGKLQAAGEGQEDGMTGRRDDEKTRRQDDRMTEGQSPKPLLPSSPPPVFPSSRPPVPPSSRPPVPPSSPLHRIRTSLHTWLRWARRMTAAELLDHVLTESGVWGSMAAGERGEQTLANIEKIIGLARGASDLAGFVADLDEQIQRGSGEGEAQLELAESDAVKIMTIHAAKGLEFPIVCVVDSSFRPPVPRENVCFHRDLGIGIKMRDADGNRVDTVMRRVIADRIKREEEAELIRLLYVGVTRARDHLIVSGTLPPIKGSWLQKICGQLDIDPDSPADVPVAEVHTDASRMPIQPLPPEPPLEEVMERYAAAAMGGRDDGRTGRGDDGTTGRRDDGMAGDTSRETAARPVVPSSHRPVTPAPPVLPSSRPPVLLLPPIPREHVLPTFSPTSLERYLECPYSYFLTEVLGVPHTGALAEDMPEPALIFAESARHEQASSLAPSPHLPISPSLIVGIVAHRFFEEISAIPAGEERAALLRFLKEQEISDPAEQQRVSDLVLRMVSDFRASDFGRRMLAAPEFYTELPFYVPIGKGVLSGKIDRLYRDAGAEDRGGAEDGGGRAEDRDAGAADAGGRWKILDYKTDDVSAAELPARSERYSAQLLAYSIAVGKLLGCEPPEATAYFTRLGRPVQFRLTPREAAAFENRLVSAIDQILAGDFEPVGQCPGQAGCVFAESEYCTKER